MMSIILRFSKAVPQVQIIQASARIAELKKLLRTRRSNSGRDQVRPNSYSLSP